jgi:hypothetical protein
MARLSRVITARLSQEEFEVVHQRAEGLCVTASALLRELLVAPSTSPVNNADHVLLSELLAMRMILINLLYKIGTRVVLTEDSINQLIQQADSEKSTRADARFLSKGKHHGEDPE